jgi:hypothetical protein
MAEDQAAAASDGTSDMPPPSTSAADSPAAQPGNSRSEREWRGDWQLPVGAVVVILVLVLVLWLLHRGR